MATLPHLPLRCPLWNLGDFELLDWPAKTSGEGHWHRPNADPSHAVMHYISGRARIIPQYIGLSTRLLASDGTLVCTKRSFKNNSAAGSSSSSSRTRPRTRSSAANWPRWKSAPPSATNRFRSLNRSCSTSSWAIRVRILLRTGDRDGSNCRTHHRRRARSVRTRRGPSADRPRGCEI